MVVNIAEVMAVDFVIFDDFLAEIFLYFIAITIAIFLWAVLKVKARYNLFKRDFKKVGADYEMNCLRIKGVIIYARKK